MDYAPRFIRNSSALVMYQALAYSDVEACAEFYWKIFLDVSLCDRVRVCVCVAAEIDAGGWVARNVSPSYFI